MSLFEDLCTGLNQAIEIEKGKLPAKKTTYLISLVKEFNKDQIKEIRHDAGMPQSVFAKYMGVSKKTVEAWECGRTHPTGSAFRLMEILNSSAGQSFCFIHVK